MKGLKGLAGGGSARGEEDAKAVEERGGVVRAGAGLGVVLDGEGREGLVAEALDGAVVEVDVRDLELRRERVREDREVVVLRGDLHLARRQLLHRMVAPVVPEREPPRLRAAGEREQLVAQTNSHDGNAEC